MVRAMSRRGWTVSRCAQTAVLAAVVGAWSLVSAPGPATAAPSPPSVGVYPTQLLFPNALRGGQYLRTVGVIDSSPTPGTFQLQASGVIASWMSFVSVDDQSTPQSTVVAKQGPPSMVALRMTVPSAAANGTYHGVVQITSSVLHPGSQGSSNQGIKISDQIPVAIVVTGTQTISGALLDASSAPQIEVGYPMRIFTVVTNTGNVAVHPSIHVMVRRAGTTMFDHVFQGDLVDPGVGPRKLETDWGTTSAAPLGRYQVHVAVAYLGHPIGNRALSVQVVPYGTLRRQGVLEGLRLANHPAVGRAAVVQATLRNTGQIETRPVFQGRLYRDGVLIDGVTSQPVLTLAGASATVSMVIDLPRGGDYRLNGTADFDGFISQSRSLTFAVGIPWWSSPLPWLAVVAVVLAGLGTVVVRRRRRPGAADNPPAGPGASPTLERHQQTAAP